LRVINQVIPYLYPNFLKKKFTNTRISRVFTRRRFRFAALQYNPQRALAQRQHSTTFVAGDKISITHYLCCGVSAAVAPMPGYLQCVFRFSMIRFRSQLGN